jgi:hypothetical protein
VALLKAISAIEKLQYKLLKIKDSILEIDAIFCTEEGTQIRELLVVDPEEKVKLVEEVKRLEIKIKRLEVIKQNILTSKDYQDEAERFGMK